MTMASITPQNKEDMIILGSTFVEEAAKIETRKDGNYFVGEDASGVSYFAEVKNKQIVGYHCKSELGVTVPSFIMNDVHLPKHVHVNADGGRCFCCHNAGRGSFTCHVIKCPAE
jgi:hypothetical protein